MIHADRTQTALVRGGDLPWVDSPEPGVERRMLERIGGEVALATSIVRYLPGSRFAAHAHALGEEFLVLEGVFSDERGHCPAGTYVRNASGSGHAPFSEGGCVIFVKLRQMAPTDTRSLRVFPGELQWKTTRLAGHERATLFEAAGETVALERLAPGVTLPPRQVEGGEELFVVEGGVHPIGTGWPLLDRWGWLRHPRQHLPGLHSPHGALLWLKRGHLAAARDRRDPDGR